MEEQEIPILQGRQVVNPYFKAAGLILRRLGWDLNPESWRSRWRLAALKNRYQGQKAVILCNGPSLLKTNFDALAASGVYTFGLNKINLLFEKTTFRPSCIVAVNELVIQQNAPFYNQTEIPLFLDSRALRYVPRRSNITYLKETHYKVFARDVRMSLYYGHTVTFVAIQLAYHMGFEKVALIGCDHSFTHQKGYANQTVVAGDHDPNHFDPTYFAGGVKWQLPDLFQSEVAYRMAREVFEASGREIYNCTEGGKLEIFQRKPLMEFLQEN